jgi:outer membrane lipoprotein SlyB
MPTTTHWAVSAVAVAAALASGCAHQSAKPAPPTISYGQVTAVQLVMVDNQRAQAAGAITGGIIGIAAGSGNTRALAGAGGALAGQQIGRVAGRRQAFEYTILIGGTTTTTMITDEGGFRIGDCVAVERGKFNNMRLADDARCAPGARPITAEVREADACIAAKDTLLTAESDEAFDRAERAVRLHCGDRSDDLLFYN